MSLKDFRARVRKVARERKGEPVFNGSTEHASVIVEAVFAQADDHVHILSEKMNARVYGPEPVIEEARLFMAEASHKVKVLLEDANEDDLRDHPFFDEFGKMANLEVRVVPETLQQRYPFHFLVMDGDSYRFEADKRQHVAVAAFGEEEGARNLENVYRTIWEKSRPVDLPQREEVNAA